MWHTMLDTTKPQVALHIQTVKVGLTHLEVKPGLQLTSLYV
jgi:hypothetical protein